MSAVTEEMRASLRSLIEVTEAAIAAGDWKVDGAADPERALERAKLAVNYYDPILPFSPLG